MDYYATLGVSRDAKSDEIHRAYRERVGQMHPDRATDPADAHRRTMSTAELNAIIAVLRDPVSRATYDRMLMDEARTGAGHKAAASPKSPTRPPSPRRPDGEERPPGDPARAGATRGGESRRTQGLGRTTAPQYAQSRRRLKPSAVVLVGSGVALAVLMTAGAVPPVVVILLLPALISTLRATGSGAPWRPRMAAWLLVFEACLPGVAGVALLATGTSNAQYALAGVASVALAATMLTSAWLVRSQHPSGIPVGTLGALGGFAWSAYLTVGPLLSSAEHTWGAEFTAWVIVPLPIVALLASLRSNRVAEKG